MHTCVQFAEIAASFCYYGEFKHPCSFISGLISVCVHKKDSNVKLNLLLEDGALNIFISSSCAEINLIELKKSSQYSSRFDNYEFFSEFACIKFQALHRLLVQN